MYPSSCISEIFKVNQIEKLYRQDEERDSMTIKMHYFTINLGTGTLRKDIIVYVFVLNA